MIPAGDIMGYPKVSLEASDLDRSMDDLGDGPLAFSVRILDETELFVIKGRLGPGIKYAIMRYDGEWYEDTSGMLIPSSDVTLGQWLHSGWGIEPIDLGIIEGME